MIGLKPLVIEDEDAGAFYEENFDDDVDYYDEDIEDDAKAVCGDYEDYPYRQASNWSCITNASSKLGP